MDLELEPNPGDNDLEEGDSLQGKEDNVGPTEAEHRDDQTEKEDDLELSGGILITRTLLGVRNPAHMWEQRADNCQRIDPFAFSREPHSKSPIRLCSV
jgi:hypothetical protein